MMARYGIALTVKRSYSFDGSQGVRQVKLVGGGMSQSRKGEESK